MDWLAGTFLLVVLLVAGHSVRFAYTSARHRDGGGYPVLGYPITSFVLLLASALVLHQGGHTLATFVSVAALPFAVLQHVLLLVAERQGTARR